MRRVEVLEQSSAESYYGICSVNRNLSEDRKVLAAMRKSPKVGGCCVSEENEG
jgi:hypothetical protein